MIEQFLHEGSLWFVQDYQCAVLTTLKLLHGRDVEVPCWIDPAVLNELARFREVGNTVIATIEMVHVRWGFVCSLIVPRVYSVRRREEMQAL